MPWIAALALALSLLAGCDRKQRSPASEPSGGSQAAGSQAAPPEAAGSQAAVAEISAAESLRRITELVDRVCACPDRACADLANAELAADNHRLAGRPRARPTPAEAQAMQAQARRLTGCVQKLP